MRNRFDNQLAELNKELISMGALCENAIASAVKSLLEGNTRLAASAIRIDHEIDREDRRPCARTEKRLYYRYGNS